MYYVKTYDYYNNEVEQLTKVYIHFKNAQLHALLLSKRVAGNKAYVTIEDDDFNRFGWYENGIDLDHK